MVAGLTKRGWVRRLVTEFVQNTATLSVVREKVDAVSIPHWPVEYPGIGSVRDRRQEVELAEPESVHDGELLSELPRRDLPQRADEVTIDITWVKFIRNKRAINKDLSYACTV